MKVHNKTHKGILAVVLAVSMLPSLASGADKSPARGTPEATRVVQPELPATTSDRGTEYANLIFRISESGEPREVTVESTSNPAYAKAMARALEKWRFEVPSGHVPGETVYRLPVVIAR